MPWYILFVNIVSGLYGALRLIGWLCVFGVAILAEFSNSDSARSEGMLASAKMGKGCLLDLILIAWWITYFVALRR